MTATTTAVLFLQPLEKRRLMSHAPGIDGIGVLGDSYSDEYQFYAPDRSTGENWVEQLAADSNANLGGFSTSDPAGPRNAGFEYNWATSAATSSDMIAGGQLSGAAAQAASGHVDLVTVFVGGNDFRDVFGVLATQGPAAAGAALAAAVPTVATNIAIAAGMLLSPQVLSANPDLHVVLTTLPKLSHLPEVRATVLAVPQIQPFVDAVDGAVQILNQLIRNIAAGGGDRIAVADFDGLVDHLFSEPKLKVGNVEVNRDALLNPTNDPSYLMLADGIHPGTILQGLLGNLFVQTANDAFGTQLDPLSTHDILQNAGLKKDQASPVAPVATSHAIFSSSHTMPASLIDGVLTATVDRVWDGSASAPRLVE